MSLQGFCSPYFTAEFRPHSQWKIGSFFPKIGQIIPKLIGVIVGKNPDLVTVSLYFAITYPVIYALFISFLHTQSSFFFDINMSHNSKYYLKKIVERGKTNTVNWFFFLWQRKRRNPMKMMVKSTFVKSNVKLTATILIVLLLLLKVVKRNHRVHLLLQTAQITLKIQSWMKIIQHSLSGYEKV